VKDLLWGRRFGDIMEVKEGMSVINWKKFDSSIQIDTSKAYVDLLAEIGLVKAQERKKLLALKEGSKPAGRRRRGAVPDVAPAPGERKLSDVESDSDEEDYDIEHIAMCPLTATPPESVKSKRVLTIFPNCTLMASGDVVPTCTFSLTVCLAYNACGIKVKLWGSQCEHPPTWMTTVDWLTQVKNGGGDVNPQGNPEKFFAALATPKHSMHKGTFGGGVPRAEAGGGGKKEDMNACLGAMAGKYFNGHEALLMHLKNTADKDVYGRFNKRTDKWDAFIALHKEIVDAINKYVRIGEESVQRETKEQLQKVLRKLDRELGSGEERKFTVGNEWHLLDAMCVPVVHRASALLTHFEGVAMGADMRNLKRYLDLSMGTEEWRKSMGVDQPLCSAAYVDNIKLVLGKGVRGKKRRVSQTICI
jgi:hypothetical protein